MGKNLTRQARRTRSSAPLLAALYVLPVMNYINNSNWKEIKLSEFQYRSDALSKVGKIHCSYEKTFDEGISVIRSIHIQGELYFVVSVIESRTSGPAESQDACETSLENAEACLNKLCEEDDKYYI